MTVLGKRLSRREDHRFLTGSGSFIADLQIPGMQDAAFVRSPVAHGHLRSLRPVEAESVDGVTKVFTHDDLVGQVGPITRSFYSLDQSFVASANVQLSPYSEPLLAGDKISRSGEAIALVVANTRGIAEDAAELVHADIEPLPAVTDPEQALTSDSPQVHPDSPGNVHARFKVEVGDVPAAITANQAISRRFRVHRATASPIENRGVVANHDDNGLTVWSTTQIPHILKSFIVEMLELPAQRVRVAAPDVGGSFGGAIYPEEILIPYAAMHLGLPVRWLEDRSEALVGSRHSRDQIFDATLAFDSDGVFKALSMKIIQDCGAFNPFGVSIPFNIASHARATYKIDAYSCEGLCVATNKTRNTPVRGAGRPEAIFVLERLIDMAASELGLDGAEIRRRNLIPADSMPYETGMLYRDGKPMVYDSGDFPNQLETALAAAGYTRLREIQAAGRTTGRYLGVGISSHVEATGLGPYETARVGVDLTGEIYVHSGAQPHGQGLETTLAQVCAEFLGVSPDDVAVRAGDTSLLEKGGGTFASRSAVTAGSSVREAAARLRTKILDLAAQRLETRKEDLTLKRGVVSHQTGEVSLAELALISVEDRGMPLEVDYEWAPETVTFGSGTAIALVEVDPETGCVTVLDYTLVDDCGTILNPAVVEGQLIGGVAHGLGNALLEEAKYDSEGQFLTGSLMDYLLPTTMDVPLVRLVHRSHPTHLNPLGVKGVGEAATSSSPAAIINGVCDALADYDVQALELPLTPERVLALIDEARFPHVAPDSPGGS